MNEINSSNAATEKKGFLVAASALFRRNPVLTAGLLIGPIVAAASNLKAAVAFSIAISLSDFGASFLTTTLNLGLLIGVSSG